jgi:NAD(P)H-hydrate epimerase
MKALTAAEMREVDRLTGERDGLPTLQLMENAGKAVAEFLRSSLTDAACKGTVVLCGKGNNGGDGLVVARLLQERGAKPAVYLFAPPASLRGDAAENLKRYRECGGKLEVVTNSEHWGTARRTVAKARLIVDALLGTGLKGRVEGLLATVIEDVNQLSRECTAVIPEMVLALDTPSGLPSDGGSADGPVLQAHITVTFTAPKIGQLISKDAGRVGRLLVREIGSPRGLVEQVGKSNVRWLEQEEFRALPLVRRADSHKGDYGHVLLVAGSKGKSGAAILAGRGALRAGAGLVTVATPDSILPIIAAGQPELMTEALGETKTGSIALANWENGRFAAVLKGKTVLAVGPGLSTDPETQQFARMVVQQSEIPVILDADGLNAFAGRASDLRRRKAKFLAITPHPGEMARLLRKTSDEVQADRAGAALQAAADGNVHVVLKGFHTIIATPEGQVFVNTTGNPGMAKGGSGDVLTGILAGLTAQFGIAEGERVLGFGVFLHGLAGEDATSARVRAAAPLLAGELADVLPLTCRRVVAEMQASG